MSRDLASLFQLTSIPTLQQDAALPAVSKTLAFDDIGDSIGTLFSEIVVF